MDMKKTSTTNEMVEIRKGITDTPLDHSLTYMTQIAPDQQFEKFILMNRKATLLIGNLGYTYSINVDVSNIIKKYFLNSEYYLLQNNIYAYDAFTFRQDSTTIYAGKDQFAVFTHKNVCDDDTEDELFQDKIIYNAAQMCINNECAKVVKYINNQELFKVVSFDYPNITFTYLHNIICESKRNNKKSDCDKPTYNEVNPIYEQICEEFIQTICQNVCNVTITQKFTRMIKFHINDMYYALYGNNEGFLKCPYEWILNASEVRLICRIFSFTPNHIRGKTFLCTKPKTILFQELYAYKTLYEIYDTRISAIYAFFDIDIYISSSTELWSNKQILDEVKKFDDELYFYFKTSFNFAISSASRQNKISIHLISTCVVVSDMDQFKNLILQCNFQSTIGKNIDTAVFRNNGCMRVADTYKDSGFMIYDYTSKLHMLTYKNRYHHLITKPVTNSCVYLTHQLSYLKSLDTFKFKQPIIENQCTCFQSVVDQLIDEHFTYNSCFSDSLKLYQFSSLVAIITNASEQYCKYLQDIVAHSESKNFANKITNIKYNFDNHQKYINKYTMENVIRQIKSLLKTYNIQLSIDTTIDKTQYTCINQKYLDEKSFDINAFMASHNLRLFVKSTMGTGKTEIIFRFLKDKIPHIKVLILCSRRSMVEEMKKRMVENNIEYLANSSDENFTKNAAKFPNTSIVISTCESIWKVYEFYTNFHLVICDEIEAIIDQMTSRETHRNRLLSNNSIFFKYVENTKLICMDGQLSDNVINIFKKENRSSYLYNLYKPEKNFEVTKSKEEFLKLIVKHFKCGRSIAIACDSKIASISMYEFLSGKQYDKTTLDNRFIVYNSDTSQLIDITDVDMTNKTIIYTPSMDVSVSITKYEPVQIFGFFINQNVSSYSKSQMLMRFRKTDNILIYEGFKYNNIDTQERIKEMIFNFEYDNFCEENVNGVVGKDLLPNINTLQNFKVANVAKKFKQFKDPSSTLHEFVMHKTSKTEVRLGNLVKMKQRPACITSSNNEYTSLYGYILKNNSYKFTFGIYIEQLLGEINGLVNTNNEEWKITYPFHIQNASTCIFIIMDRYYWLTLKRDTSQEVIVKGAVSLVYHLANFHDTHNYTSITDFKDTFLSNEANIKMFVTLLKGHNRNTQLFLYFILKSIFKMNDKIYVDMTRLRTHAGSICTRYFKFIKDTKVKFYLKRFIPNVEIINKNPNPKLYKYYNIFENEKQPFKEQDNTYKNDIIDYINNITVEDIETAEIIKSNDKFDYTNSIQIMNDMFNNIIFIKSNLDKRNNVQYTSGIYDGQFKDEINEKLKNGPIFIPAYTKITNEYSDQYIDSHIIDDNLEMRSEITKHAKGFNIADLFTNQNIDKPKKIPKKPKIKDIYQVQDSSDSEWECVDNKWIMHPKGVFKPSKFIKECTKPNYDSDSDSDLEGYIYRKKKKKAKRTTPEQYDTYIVGNEVYTNGSVMLELKTPEDFNMFVNVMKIPIRESKQDKAPT